MKKNSAAFTLIELLIVITIVIILASIAYPAYTGVQERARATQCMNNLRQIGLATQMYLNDNDNTLFSTDGAAGTWMAQLKPKYVPAWKIFQSGFDKRTLSEQDATAPISYGLNGNGLTGGSIAGLLTDKITNASAFILFAPAQTSGGAVAFTGTPATAVTVYKDTGTQGTATGGTHSNRKRINVLFADLHSEPLTWIQFKNDSDSDTADPDAKFRWHPYRPYQ